MSSINYDIANQTTLEPRVLISKTDDNTKAIKINKDGIKLEYDITTAIKTFELNSAGISWTDGVTPYTTSLGRLAAVQQAFQAVELPPNATTLKVNKTLLCDGGTANKTTSVNDGSIVVNNNTGGTTTPAITLNQTGTSGGILVEEIYNQRTATAGEFNRMSFFAKNNATPTQQKVEYARIHQNATTITNGNEKGRIDFAVKEGGAGMIDYLTLNANTTTITMNRTLSMNSQSISNCSQITTNNGTQYGKNNINYFNGDTTYPITPPDTNTRCSLINIGVPPSLQPLADPFPSTWGTITASTNWLGYTYVGTDNGLIYYSSDGVNWTQVNIQLNGRINALIEYSGYLMIGGDFTYDNASVNPCNYICRIDSGNSFSQVIWSNISSNGFNQKVNCFYVNSSGYLVIGGNFTYDNTISLQLSYIAFMDIGFNIYSIDNSIGTGYGFNGEVIFIREDIYNTGHHIIGGNFNYFQSIYGGTSCNYIIDIVITGYDESSPPIVFVNLDNTPLSCAQNGSSIYIVGNFSASGLIYSPYFLNVSWNGSTYQQDPLPYGFFASSPINNIVQDGGIFWTESAGSYYIYDGGVAVATSPFSVPWSHICRAIWGQTIYSTTSSSQNPVVAYFISSSNVITLTLTDGGTIQNGASSYTGGFQLLNKGAVIDMIYNSGTYWVITANNSTFF